MRTSSLAILNHHQTYESYTDITCFHRYHGDGASLQTPASRTQRQ